MAQFPNSGNNSKWKNTLELFFLLNLQDEDTLHTFILVENRMINA